PTAENVDCQRGSGCCQRTRVFARADTTGLVGVSVIAARRGAHPTMPRRAHTPPDTPPPAQPAGAAAIDLVAGDPPVPITVWRTPCGDGQASVPLRLAQRLVSAYSRPGEVVIDVTDDHALCDAAGHGGRRHHPGWFTDASTLVIGPPTPTPAPTRD